MSKRPNPYPQSAHVARAESVKYANQKRFTAICDDNCICLICEARRKAFVAGWAGAVKAGRKAKKGTNE